VTEVNKLLKQFEETRKMMKMMTTAKLPGKGMAPKFRR
jgi:signal recognition particle subunit SRP54